MRNLHRSHRSYGTHDSGAGASTAAAAPETYELYRPFVESRPADVVANIAICLIHQANYLLDRQLRALESRFIENGGIRERMTNARLEHRRKAPPG